MFASSSAITPSRVVGPRTRNSKSLVSSEWLNRSRCSTLTGHLLSDLDQLLFHLLQFVKLPLVDRVRPQPRHGRGGGSRDDVRIVAGPGDRLLLSGDGVLLRGDVGHQPFAALALFLHAVPELFGPLLAEVQAASELRLLDVEFELEAAADGLQVHAGGFRLLLLA